jgi:mRNA interferase MazF
MKTFYDKFKSYNKPIYENKNWIDMKEVSRLVNLAKGNRNTSQFLTDMNLTCETEQIIDMINGRYNSCIRLHHLKKIAKASEGRVDFDQLNAIFKFMENNSLDELKNINIERSDICQVNLGEALDNEHGGIKMCVVISNNKGNGSSATFQLIPLSSSIGKNYIPSHVPVGLESGILKPSVAMIEQLRVKTKASLLFDGEIIKVGKVSEATMIKIESAIKKQFGMISLNFNPRFAEEMVRAILGVMNVVEDDDNLVIAKNLLWKDLEAYCADYDKDAKSIFNEFTTKIARGEPVFKRFCLVG